MEGVAASSEYGDAGRAAKEGRRLLHEPHRTQQDAIDAARRHARQHQPAQVIVHALDGHIRSAYTYGETPAMPPGERGRKAGEQGGIS
ncbi:DUF2188 domain-containing protein [Streptomyces lavendulae]|uniref:DUF2188 domain-containing protein n=1 Tax=Streptomyces lavendulae TaxID=1914 RepID=UPI0036E171C0